jgi:hypothetical protein
MHVVVPVLCVGSQALLQVPQLVVEVWVFVSQPLVFGAATSQSA